MSVTIRISELTRDSLKEMAAQQGLSMQAVLEAALKNYRQSMRIQAFNEAYARLPAQDRADLEQEVKFWDRATVMDGLDPEDVDY